MKNSIYLVVIAFIVFILLQIAPKTQDSIVDGKIERKIDTIIRVDTIINYDTIIEYAVKYKDRKVTDTVYVETENKPFLALPVVSKHFTKENLYDVWVSGVEPLEMDSIMVYPRTEYRTITNTERTTVDKKETDIYVNAGLSHADGSFMPRVGISIKTKRNVLYGAEIGSFDGKTFLGVNVGFKINK